MIIISSGKILILMRGVSGAGKSTKARQLAQGGVIFSTDDFFMKEGKYVFDPALLPEYHKLNLERTIQAMYRGVSPIVVDNTNLKASYMKPYVTAAMKHGYQVRIEESDSPEWKSFKKDMPPAQFDALVKEFSRRNKHDVPEENVRKMMEAYEHGLTVEDILKSTSEP